MVICLFGRIEYSAPALPQCVWKSAADIMGFRPRSQVLLHTCAAKVVMDVSTRSMSRRMAARSVCMIMAAIDVGVVGTPRLC